MRLPPDSLAIIYETPIPRFVVGRSGQRYQVKPNAILLDVKTPDANDWLASGQARKPSSRELPVLRGHMARLS